ncbi:MAG: cysteine hydrolase family protein [Bacteroidales bacterium]
MKKILVLLIISFLFAINGISLVAQENSGNKNPALLIIDIQEFYFPKGSVPLVNPEEAALNASKLLNEFRKNDFTVVHIRHNASSGGDIHPIVMPLEDEKVISKNKANAFIDTDLLDYLKNKNITDLVICGMQTHMCVEAATRAASDYGFNCTVVDDACATRDLKFGEITVSAQDVHYSTLSSLNRTYATIKTTQQFFDELKNE